jgi:hypothetical protein
MMCAPKSLTSALTRFACGHVPVSPISRS